MTAEIHKDNYDDPLTVGDIDQPKAHIKIINNGDEPAYDARLIIESDVLLDNNDVEGCQSLAVSSNEVKILSFSHIRNIGLLFSLN